MPLSPPGPRPARGLAAVAALILSLLLPIPAVVAQPVGQQQQVRQWFSQQEIEQMLAPVALYPDALLAQVLMAATYPLEVVMAARWTKANPGLQGEQAVNAVADQDWDPSVKALVAFPPLLALMDERLDWTGRLGDAFLGQQAQVMDTVQTLRRRAYIAGNLGSTNQILVDPQVSAITIEPANPGIIAMPYYDPTAVYGPWPAPAYPPDAWGAPAGIIGSPFSGPWYGWSAPVVISSGILFGRWDWGRHVVRVGPINPIYRRRTIPERPVAVPPGLWQHEPSHRKGVPYRDDAVRQRYERPAPAPAPAPAPKTFDGRKNQPREAPVVQPREAPVGQPPGAVGDRPRDKPRNEGRDDRNRPAQQERPVEKPAGQARAPGAAVAPPAPAAAPASVKRDAADQPDRAQRNPSVDGRAPAGNGRRDQAPNQGADRRDRAQGNAVAPVQTVNVHGKPQKNEGAVAESMPSSTPPPPDQRSRKQ
jgi:hypothetical protein